MSLLAAEEWVVETASRHQLFAARDVSLRLGETVYVVGPSGAGKTTFLKSLAALNEGCTTRYRGDVSDGLVVSYVGGEARFLDGQTVAEVLAFHLLHSDEIEDAEECARTVGLEDLLASPVQRCSTGERRRLQILCAMLRKPALLLLDEPTSGLSSIEATVVMRAVHALHDARSLCVVAVLHQPRHEVLGLCTSIWLCAGGGLRRQCAYEALQTEMWASTTGDSVLERVLDAMDRAPCAASGAHGLRPYPPPCTGTRSATGLLTSLYAACCRDVIVNARSWGVYASHCASLAFIVWLLVSVYGNQPYDDVYGFIVQMFLLFATFQTYFGFSKMALLRQERNVLVRERYTNMVSPFVLLVSRWPSMLLYSLFVALATAPVVLWRFGRFSWSRNASYTAMLWMVAMNGFALRWMVETSFRSIDVASAVATAVTCVFSLFNGVLTEREYIPFHLRWMTYLSPLYYVLNSLGYIDWTDEGFDALTPLDALTALLLFFLAMNAVIYWNLVRLGRWESTY